MLKVIGHLFSLIILWSVKTTFSEALPREPDIAMPAGNVFSSADFKTTDEVCQHMYYRWISAANNVGQQTGKGIKLPLVISWDVKMVETERFEATCRDFRSLAVLGRAITDRQETRDSDTIYLQCNPDTEESYLLQRPSNTAGQYRRRIGICRPKNKARTSGSQSTLVRAGDTACINAQNTDAAALMAYLEQDDYDGDTRTEDDYAEWVKIMEIGTSRQVQDFGHKSVVTMVVDQKHPTTYRACAKQQSGHGNARLFLVAL